MMNNKHVAELQLSKRHLVRLYASIYVVLAHANSWGEKLYNLCLVRNYFPSTRCEIRTGSTQKETRRTQVKNNNN